MDLRLRRGVGARTSHQGVLVKLTQALPAALACGVCQCEARASGGRSVIGFYQRPTPAFTAERLA